MKVKIDKEKHLCPDCQQIQEFENITVPGRSRKLRCCYCGYIYEPDKPLQRRPEREKWW